MEGYSNSRKGCFSGLSVPKYFLDTNNYGKNKSIREIIHALNPTTEGNDVAKSKTK